ncbi:MAG: prolipoprotein diacylglyceryl transferase, partial [Xanthomonadales bacterium]|nr:prolipoprotein diacylglyceryl transferase [Xanthomonadales bacterium]
MEQNLPYFVDIDPVAIAIGPLPVIGNTLSIHWYGIMYLLAFFSFWKLAEWRAKKDPWRGWQPAEVSDYLFYSILGVILGGRVGYMLFYANDQLLSDPLSVLRIWDGGMSFHGGLLGLLLVVFMYGRKTRRGFWNIADFSAPLGTLGLMFGRVGNFIGGELWGRKTDSDWGVIFPGAIDSPLPIDALRELYLTGALNAEARHPSQLYQAGLEGLALFLILWFYSRKPRPRAAVSGLFLLGYGVFRFIAEFFRQPDEHLQFIAFDWLTMGQLLSLPMVIAGAILILYAYRSDSPQFIK